MRSSSAILITLVLCAIAAPAGAERYILDPAHSRVTFTVTKWGIIDVEGQAQELRGELSWDPANPAGASTTWSIPVASLRTGEPDRDESLRAPEYFDAARFPTASFTSTRARSIDAQHLALDGQLTLRGVTRPLSLVVAILGERDVPGEGRLLVFETAFTLNRRDFGIVGGRVLGPVISDEVRMRVRAVGRLVPATSQPTQ